jgi:predicted RNase H-like HicB family nuclease
MVIRWSDRDKLYIAHLPEFGDGAKTHGATYEEAAKNGREVLEMLVESYMADGEPLPKPQKYQGSRPPVRSRIVSKKRKLLTRQA